MITEKLSPNRKFMLIFATVLYFVVGFFAVPLEVPIGNFIDKYSVSIAMLVAASVTAITAVMMVLTNNVVYLYR